ncbi:MAG: TolC family protein [Hallerella porci]|uniref:OMF family outer membrane factor n=1 Tax=Hallerella porci TaxID=1945871 RepID=A0ABX5LJA8_9BACT|nr:MULTISPECIES: TolC family protein [Hallerella]MCI5600284.1 TolC family protein [Hallerella sp.]MDY3921263.1 TolC family protein [Hallerella porci]PWK94791.1 OMF family outer membrane factor [Hallerella porci]
MNRTVKLLILSSAILAMPAFAKSAYTRDDAVRIALENSPDIKSAEQDLASAESQVTSAYGSALPTVDLSATYTRTFGVGDVKKNSAISDMLDDAATKNEEMLAGVFDNYNYAMAKMGGYRWGTQIGITATQVLYAQGKVSTGTEIAKSYRRVSELSLETAKQDVRYNVEVAFDELIYLDSAIVILQSTIDQLQENLDYVTQAVQSGLATELDLIRVQISMDELQTNLQKTQKNRIIARNSLLNTMGLPWDAEAEFNGDLRDPKNGYAAPDTVMENVRKRRKELAQLDESVKMYENNIDIEAGDYKPTLVLGGSITYQDGNNDFFKWSAPDWDDNISKRIYLNFSMNLFNGMKTREAVVQAKTTLRKTQIQRENADRGIQLEMESAKNTLEDAENQIEIQQRRVELAQKNLDMTEAAYKAGRETQLNFLDANMSLKNARLDYLSAIVDWNKAYNAMLKATGEY